MKIKILLVVFMLIINSISAQEMTYSTRVMDVSYDRTRVGSQVDTVLLMVTFYNNNGEKIEIDNGQVLKPMLGQHCNPDSLQDLALKRIELIDIDSSMIYKNTKGFTIWSNSLNTFNIYLICFCESNGYTSPSIGCEYKFGDFKYDYYNPDLSPLNADNAMCDSILHIMGEEIMIKYEGSPLVLETAIKKEMVKEIFKEELGECSHLIVFENFNDVFQENGSYINVNNEESLIFYVIDEEYILFHIKPTLEGSKQLTRIVTEFTIELEFIQNEETVEKSILCDYLDILIDCLNNN